MNVDNLTLDQTEQVRECCRACDEWKPCRIAGFYACAKHHTDSTIFLVARCAKLHAILTHESERQHSYHRFV